MKKLVSLLIAAVLALSCAAPAFAGERTDFVPVLRFVASSDTHVDGGNDKTANRIGKMLDLAYERAGSDSAYGNLDALLIAGDLTNNGTKEEFDKFWNAVSSSLRGDTRFLGVVAKNHDGYKMSRTELRSYYSSLTGNEPDFHTVINGYHFIGVSASENDMFHYDRKQLSWLKEQLDEAVAEDPAKPVFVMHHEHVRNTVYGSSFYDGWGVTYFTSILKNYPQVVDFSGHSHYPLNHPNSVWQGDFTAVGTGAIYYSEFTVDETRTYHPEDSGDTATCWIVEVDAYGNIHLKGIDVEADEVLCEYMLDNPADPANRNYTPEARKAASKPPVFAEDAVPEITPEYGGCKIVSPVAESADGMPVVLYRAYAVNKSGQKVSESWTLPEYYRAVEQEEVELSLEGLSKGEYKICVVAENAYGGQSDPIEATVTVDGGSAIKALFYRIGVIFSRLLVIIKNYL